MSASTQLIDDQRCPSTIPLQSLDQHPSFLPVSNQYMTKAKRCHGHDSVGQTHCGNFGNFLHSSYIDETVAYDEIVGKEINLHQIACMLALYGKKCGDQMPKIRTVLGDIDPDDLGLIYTHEHLFTNPPAHQEDRDLEISSYECSLRELTIFKEHGGTLLVEASTLDYGRDAASMARVSAEAGVHLVAVTGFNKALYFPLWVETTPVNAIAEMLILDVVKGMDGGPHKAGHLKSGSSYNVIHRLEEKVTQAVGHAYRETEAPIWLHTECGTMGMEMLDILADEGVDLEAVVVGHCDRNPDPFYHAALANRGATVQFDGVGKIKYHPDSVRISCIKALLDAGHEDRLMISGDMGRCSYLTGYGGGPGFGYIAGKFIPRMRAEGINETAIEKIFTRSPVRWLARF